MTCMLSCWGKISLVVFCILSCLPANATDVSLINFASQVPDFDDTINVSDVRFEKFPLPNAPGTPPITHSSTFKRNYTDAEAQLTYTLQNPFTFTDYASPRHEIRFWIHIDGPPTMLEGEEPFSGQATHPPFINVDLLTDHYVYTTSHTYLVTRGWNEIKLALALDPTSEHVSANAPVHRRKSIFLYTGGQDIEPVKKIRIRFASNPDCETIGLIRLAECRLRPVDPCKIIMFYDDCRIGVQSIVKPYYVANNMEASLAVVGKYFEGRLSQGGTKNNAAVRASGFLVESDIVSLYNSKSSNGSFMFDCVNHSYQHFQLSSFSDYTDVKNEILSVLTLLKNKGLTRDDAHKMVVYPGGSSNLNVFAALDELALPYGRTIGIGSDPAESSTDFIVNPYAGGAYDMAAAENGINGYSAVESVEQFKDWIDQGVLEGRPRFIVYHDVANTKGAIHNSNNWNSTAFWTATSDYLKTLRNQGKLQITTLAKWYKSLDGLHKMKGIGY